MARPSRSRNLQSQKLSSSGALRGASFVDTIVAYIPRNAAWYVAEIVEEIRVEGDSRNVVHRNLVLVEAGSPEDAYNRAIQLGRDNECSYANPEGRMVVCRFCGLAELNVIHDKLEHGAEIMFWEDVSVSENQIKTWVKSKERLAVFREIEPTTGPSYSSKDVLEDAIRLTRDLQNQKEK